MKSFFSLLCVLCGLAGSAFGQIQISGIQYVTEQFDGLGSSATAALPANWGIDKQTAVRTLGTYSGAATATENRAGNNMSSSAGNGIYNFGAGDPASAGDRAVGWISTSGGTKSGNLYVYLHNTESNDLTINVCYSVEKYRQGTNAAGYRIQMYYSTDGGSWTNAGNSFLTAWSADASNTGYAPAPGDSVPVCVQGAITAPAGSDFYLAWNYSVTSGTNTSNAQAIGIDDICIGSGANCPVELTRFGASMYPDRISIYWETATEVDNHGFEVERKSTGSIWERISFVEGHGTSNVAHYYTCIDQHPPLMDRIAYRLKQINRDGSFEYSQEITMPAIPVTGFRLLGVYPNPVLHEGWISLVTQSKESVCAMLYDNAGCELQRLFDGSVEAGRNTIHFIVGDVPTGVYHCVLLTGKNMRAWAPVVICR
jgi:hypothetical protein